MARSKANGHGGWQLFMLALCVFVLAMMAFDAFVPLDSDTKQILTYLDHGICIIFLFDFFANLIAAENKLAFLKWGWIDLLSSIPAIDVLRWGRVARILRILRLLRGIKSTRILVGFLLQRRAENGFLAATLISLLLVAFSSIAILKVEAGAADANILTAEDSLWWAFVTMTTVGYGDTYPVTSEGRLIAMALMAAGVGLFGTLTGLIATGFLEPQQEEHDSELEAIRRELGEIRAMLEEQGRGGNES